MQEVVTFSPLAIAFYGKLEGKTMPGPVTEY
jgi:hypothetical protein